MLIGRALEVQGQYDKAIEKYDEALGISAEGKEADSQRFAAELGKASALAAGGKIDEAVKLINEVIAKADPENQEIYARAYVTLGNCYKAAGKPKTRSWLSWKSTCSIPARPSNMPKRWLIWPCSGQKSTRPIAPTQAKSQLEGRYPHSRWLTKPAAPPSG